MITANLGNAPWTSAGETLELILPFSVGVCVTLLHFFSFLLSYLMRIKLGIKLVIQSLLLAVFYGLFIDVFLHFHQMIFIPESLFIRFIYLFMGMNLIAIGICIYFQSGKVYLPTDYLLKAFGQRMKNYTFGNILFTAIPITIALAIVLYKQTFVGVGIGTVLYMFITGMLIDQYFRWIIIGGERTDGKQMAERKKA